MDPKVARYIAVNRERYTREAIDAHLLRAGHDWADIDAAWSQVGGEVRPSRSEDRAFWRAFLGSVGAMYGITFLVYAVGFRGGFDISGIFLVFLLVAALSSLGPSVALARQYRSAGRGVVGGLLIALVIPFVFLVIVAGLCTALTGAPFAGSGA